VSGVVVHDVILTQIDQSHTAVGICPADKDLFVFNAATVNNKRIGSHFLEDNDYNCRFETHYWLACE